MGAGSWDGSMAVGDWKATQIIPPTPCQERVVPCWTKALLNPSKSCQTSGLTLPSTLCLEKFTLPYKPHVFPPFIHSQQNLFIHCKEFLPFLGVCALWIFIGCYHIHLAHPGYMYSALLILLRNSIPPTPSSFFVVLLSTPASSSCSFCFG